MVWGGGDPIPTFLAPPTLDAKIFGYGRGTVGSRNCIMVVVASWTTANTLVLLVCSFVGIVYRTEVYTRTG
jgi:hypothetical protein